MQTEVLENLGLMSIKQCCTCRESKSLDDFAIDKARPDGLYPRCKTCTNNYDKSRRKARRCYTLTNMYGITLEQYNTMLDKQGGVCAICLKEETLVRRGKVVPLSVDHCHSTSKVRGLLCSHCNTALGKFKDNVDYLRNAIKYLGDI